MNWPRVHHVMTAAAGLAIVGCQYLGQYYVTSCCHYFPNGYGIRGCLVDAKGSPVVFAKISAAIETDEGLFADYGQRPSGTDPATDSCFLTFIITDGTHLCPWGWSPPLSIPQASRVILTIEVADQSQDVTVDITDDMYDSHEGDPSVYLNLGNVVASGN